KEMRKTGGVPYTLLKQGQTNKYYFTNVLGILGEIDEKGYAKNYFSLFYEKATGRSFYFKKTTEGLAIRPDMTTEEALYQLIPTEDLELLLPVLDETEKAKVMKRVEDDNPCLVKFIP
ncbi:MAG: 6-bladed beta-propeller, partial [Bacteroides sp.]|nr:6-bladed beta-propeller [Bacteroides sp.]